MRAIKGAYSKQATNAELDASRRSLNQLFSFFSVSGFCRHREHYCGWRHSACATPAQTAEYRVKLPSLILFCPTYFLPHFPFAGILLPLVMRLMQQMLSRNFAVQRVPCMNGWTAGCRSASKPQRLPITPRTFVSCGIGNRRSRPGCRVPPAQRSRLRCWPRTLRIAPLAGFRPPICLLLI